jgi:hypothetical protein
MTMYNISKSYSRYMKRLLENRQAKDLLTSGRRVGLAARLVFGQFHPVVPRDFVKLTVVLYVWLFLVCSGHFMVIYNNKFKFRKRLIIFAIFAMFCYVNLQISVISETGTNPGLKSLKAVDCLVCILRCFSASSIPSQSFIRL